jgi:hypothetical protein
VNLNNVLSLTYIRRANRGTEVQKDVTSRMFYIFTTVAPHTDLFIYQVFVKQGNSVSHTCIVETGHVLPTSDNLKRRNVYISKNKISLNLEKQL